MSENIEKEKNLNMKLKNYGELSVMELMDIGKEIIHQLTNLDLLGSEVKIEEGLEYIKKLKEDYIIHGTKEITKQLDIYITKIKEMFEKAKTFLVFLDIDLSDCFENEKTKLENLAKNFLESFKDCINAAERNIMNMLKNVMNTVNDIKEEISKLPSELSSSIISWDPQKSLMEFMEKLSDMSKKYPEQIVNLVKDSTDLVSSLKDTFMDNLKDVLDEMDKASKQILLDIALFVAGKVRDRTIEYLNE